MRYDLVIFDNDGVLVDSEPISNRILAAYLTELGHPTTYREAVRDFMGGSIAAIHDVIEARSGRRLPAEFDATLHARVFAAFASDLVAVPGVDAALAHLAVEGVPTCVASSSAHVRIAVGLARTGLAGWFSRDRIFSADDVAHGKPAPDLFLHAARSLGVQPARCAVIEDSPRGIEAAVAAGMDAFGFAAMTPAARLAGARAVFTRMADVVALLAAEPAR